MTRQRHTTVCLEGWYYLLILAMVCLGAILGGVNLLLVLTGMLAGPILFSWQALAKAFHGLNPRRKLPHGLCAGDLLVVNISLANTRRKTGSWAVVVEEQIRRDSSPGNPKRLRDESICPSVLFPYVPAGESREATYRGRLARRGRYRLGPLRLSTRFPFGLFRRRITVGRIDHLTVFPRLGRLTGAWTARHHEALAGTGRHERKHGNEGDFYGIRPWQSGDSRRWIDWRGSARTGKLLVRQFEQPRNRDMAVLLNLWQPEPPEPQHIENVERAVSFAATVVTDLCRKGDGDLYLATTSPQPTGARSEILHGTASAALLQDAMETLAVAEAGSDNRLGELLARSHARIAPGTEIVLISTRPVDPTAVLQPAMRKPDVLQPDRLPAEDSRRASAAIRTSAGRIRCIDTSSDELMRYYQVE